MVPGNKAANITYTGLQVSTNLEIAKGTGTGASFACLKSTKDLPKPAQTNKDTIDRKSFYPVRFPDLEKEIVEFVSTAGQERLRITLNILVAKNTPARKELLSKSDNEVETD